MNNSKVGTIKVGVAPVAIGVDSNQSKVYVANSYDNTIFVINSTTDSVIGTIKVGARPQAIGVANNDENRNLYKVYVANSYDNTIFVIDAATDKVASDSV